MMVTETPLDTMEFTISLVELEERRRGFAKLNAAYKSLKDIVSPEEGPSYFDQWSRAMKPSLLRISSLAAEIATAECTLAVDIREEVSHRYSNV